MTALPKVPASLGSSQRRANWTFADSERGGERAAATYT
jgi:hypothetical protein